MGVSEVVRAAEFALPLLAGMRRRRSQREAVENHELFHYLRLIEAQKVHSLPSPMQETFREVVEDFRPAFEGALEEPESLLTGSPYWERFMRERQRVIPTYTSSLGDEFFHLEKLVFQSIQSGVYRDKYHILYHIFTLYLLFLKILVDNWEREGGRR